MEILIAALVALAVGVALSVVLGNPLWLFVALIVGALDANRAGYRHQWRAISASLNRGAPASDTGGPSTAERLAELASLRDRQLITPEEYAAKRTELLERL
jgi:hypothetical protein